MMVRNFSILCCLILPTPALRAAVPPELPSRTATRAPAPLPFAGTWRRIDLAYEKEGLAVSKRGLVQIGEAGSEANGQCRLLSGQTIQLTLRTPFGFQRLTCRWWMDGSNLVLEVLESKSKTNDQDVYQPLDQDRSAEGQTWRFKQGR